MEARGRNGWFKVGRIGVWKLNDGTTQIEVWSKRGGKTAPLLISGTIEEVEAFLTKAASMLDELVREGRAHRTEMLSQTVRKLGGRP